MLSYILSFAFKSANLFPQLQDVNWSLKKQRNSNNLLQLPTNNCVYTLVERERGFKNKYDFLVRNSGACCFRIVCDLRDFKIAEAA